MFVLLLQVSGTAAHPEDQSAEFEVGRGTARHSPVGAERSEDVDQSQARDRCSSVQGADTECSDARVQAQPRPASTIIPYDEPPQEPTLLERLFPEDQFVRLPITPANALALTMLLVLSMFGVVYIYKLATQPKCSCPMCDGQYIVKNRLGSGGFGDVYVAIRASDNQRVVIKKIPVQDLNDANNAHTEARELRFLQHPRIVGFEDDFLHVVARTAGRDARIYVCIVMEHCERDLRRSLDDHRRDGKPFPEDQLLKYLAQLCTALSYCHSKHIIHRDIKPQNVFLDVNDNVRLGDFGLCRPFRKAVTRFTDAGTDCYKAPETLLGGKRDGRKADVWSLGLLLHELTTHTLAWERQEALGAQLLHYTNALDEIMRLVPSSYSPQFRKLMRRLLSPLPRSRPTADEVLSMRLMRQFVRKDARLRQRQLAKLKQSAERDNGDDDNYEQRLSSARRDAAGRGRAQSKSSGSSDEEPTSPPRLSSDEWLSDEPVDDTPPVEPKRKRRKKRKSKGRLDARTPGHRRGGSKSRS